jgi:hypothetical protein
MVMPDEWLPEPRTLRSVPENAELMAVVRGALAGPAGNALLAHLQRRFADHVLGPSASDAELRHLEGQRSVVAYLRHLVATARRAPSGDLE